MNEIKIRVTSDEEGERIDKFLSSASEDLTRSFIQNLIKEGHLTVNKKNVKASYIIRENDEIILVVPDPISLDVKPSKMDLDIVYEDDSLLIINKDKGTVVHPAPGHMDDTLVNGLLYYLKDNLSSINGVLRPGIVHRIDRDTSGLLIICKNDASHKEIASQLKEHSINRIYYGIVCGSVKEDSGTIDEPIGRDPKDRKRMAIDREKGKRAVTHYSVIERFKGYTLMRFKLETGRTHQIRVHMSYINHPLMGDEKYNAPRNRFGVKGQMLHAAVIGFIHPETDEYMEFEAKPPEYFNDILEKLRDK